ncbi:MAG: alpha-galactosidase [Acutalibacteraceae bacterium]
MIHIKDNIFHLNTQNTSYIFAVTEHGDLQHLYYGDKISEKMDYSAFFEKRSMLLVSALYPENDITYGIDAMQFEYSVFGGGDRRENACVINCGETLCSFTFAGYNILTQPPMRSNFAQAHSGDGCLCVLLRDEHTETEMRLYYQLFEKFDVITRYVEIKANKNAVGIESIMSMQLDLPMGKYKCITFDGAWARERFKHEQPLTAGKIVCDSQSGASGAWHNPFVMLAEKNADNFSGESYGFNLIYSGNHREVFEVSPYGGVRVLNGISPAGFRFSLQQGESFFTPESVLTYSPKGYNGVSENMHKFVQNHILPKVWASSPKPVLLNSWESMYFDISEEKLCALADRAAEIGVELLVIDDGWFGERNDDTSSLGDWQENRAKFPNGVRAVTDYVHKKGLKLGIWVEPEMISRNSKLFEVHPDWALGLEQGRRVLGRSQYVLDLSRSEVQDFLIETVCSVINICGADYVKWDFNRMFSDFTSVATPLYEVQHTYVCGLYRILSEITARFPNVLFELCASGGARFDLGMLCFMPIGWVSDNTDVLSRALIQEGTSYGYPISAMCNHISAVPNHQTKRISTLETRNGIASFGVLGLQYDLTKLPKEELVYLKNCIAEYKQMRPLITDGSFYRLTDGFEDNFTAWQLVSADKKTVYVILFHKLFFPVSQLPKLKLLGLSPDFVYDVDITGLKVSGEVLMKHGLLPLQNYQGNEQSKNGHSLTDFSAVIYQLKALGEAK